MSFTVTTNTDSFAQNCTDTHVHFYYPVPPPHTHSGIIFMKYQVVMFFLLVIFWGSIDFIVPQIMLFIQTYSFTNEGEDEGQDEGQNEGHHEGQNEGHHEGHHEGEDEGFFEEGADDDNMGDHDDIDNNSDDDGGDDDGGDDDGGDDDGADDDGADDDNEANMFNFDKGIFERPKYTAYFTGDWRKPEMKPHFEKIKYWFAPEGHDQLRILSQEDEARLQAKSAFELFDRAYNAKNTVGSTIGNFFLAAGAGRGSAQFTVMDAAGNVIEIFTGPGIAKNETAEQAEERKIMYDQILTCIANSYEIGYAVFFDAMFHLIKNTEAPFVPDGAEMPRSLIDVPTMTDFVEFYGFGKAISNTKTLVIRNVKITTEFGTVKRKISFITGEDYQFDIGSGKGALVDPLDGVNAASFQFGEWQEYENELYKVAHFIAFPENYSVA